MEKTDWTTLAGLVHKAAVDKGFYECEQSLSQSLMLVITEVAEIVEADRKEWRAKVDEYKQHGKLGFSPYIKNSVEDEMADVALRLLDLCFANRYKLNMVDDYCKNYSEYEPLKSIPETCFELCKKITSDSDFCVIYSFSFLLSRAELMDIDLVWFIKEKMIYNTTRPYKHDKKY